MARKVFLHVGLPKTGTTYLQTIMWANRDLLREQAVLLPGDSGREHLWASVVVREDPAIVERPPRAPLAWDKLVGQVNAWPDTALISHEFFGGASVAQARAALATLGAAECHVVVTARDTLSLVTARWQEFVKNGSTVPLDDYPASDVTDPHDEWDWGNIDLAGVLTRWGSCVPDERVHVIIVPGADAPRDQLWTRFADVVGIDPTSCDITAAEANESLGVVEVEFLRRVNDHLPRFASTAERVHSLRRYLAHQKLVPRGGERFLPAPERIEEIRVRSRAAVDLVRERDFDVVGDIEDLVVVEDLPQRRHPDSVTDAEMLSAATATIAEMLGDLRDLKQELRKSERAARRLRGTQHDE